MFSPIRFAGPRNAALRFIAPLVGGVVLLNLLVLGMATLGLSQSRDLYVGRAATASKNLAVLLERELLSTFGKIDLALLAVADDVARVRALPDGETTALDEFILRQSARLPELHGLRITDAQGDVTRGFGMVKGLRANLANRPYFMQLASQPGAGLVISKPVVSRISGEWEIVLARRVPRADGTFDGVVYATIALQHFVDLFSDLDVGRRGIVSLRDAELGVIVRHPVMTTIGGDVGNANVSTPMRELLRAGQVAGTYTARAPSDGIERTFSFRRITGYPMLVVVGLGTEDYLAAWKIEAAKTGALAFAFAALTLAFTVLMIRSWKRRESDHQTLAVEERKFRTLLESSPDALVFVDAREIISVVNRQTVAMFGYSQAELIGGTMAMLLPERYRGLRLGSLSEAPGPAIDASKDRDLWAVTKDGREFPVSISLSPIATEQGGMVAAAIRDMTERRASEEHMEFMAHHDALTGLPNRLVVQSRCEQAIAQAARTGSTVALLFVDLDNFKTVNDSLGHSAGDAMLKAVANRLRECARETDTISRHGGDEFLVVFAELADAEAAITLVERLIQQFQRPLQVDGRELTTSLSLGIALYPDDGHEFAALLKKADIAMYQAKEAGRNTHRFFNEDMNVEAVEHLQIRNGLRLALDRGEFTLYYQPQIDLVSGRVVGAEALIRWNHPELGLVLPGRFISVAEESGLIVPMGDWVLREACHQAAAWRDAGLPPLTVAVNLSAVQFGRGDVERSVEHAIESAGLDPEYLELELTESILIRNAESALATIQRLKRLGVRLSLDDFGTGYSSLSYLKRFAFDKLKIDQSFIRDLGADPESVAIVRAILQMAGGLGLKTIAEGVESEAALERLLFLRCDEAQGYYFARPLPAEQFVAFLATTARRTPPGVWSSGHAARVADVPAMSHEGDPADPQSR